MNLRVPEMTSRRLRSLVLLHQNASFGYRNARLSLKVTAYVSHVDVEHIAAEVRCVLMLFQGWLQASVSAVDDDVEVITPLPTGGYKVPNAAPQEALKVPAKAPGPPTTPPMQTTENSRNHTQVNRL